MELGMYIICYIGLWISGNIRNFKQIKGMDKKELKEKLYRQIEEMDELTPTQIERLKQSQEQLNNGQWKSHEEVQKIISAYVAQKTSSSIIQ
jgi:hypothetical protein